jgi:RNA polymerase sigma factor (sigma-70 family)
LKGAVPKTGIRSRQRRRRGGRRPAVRNNAARDHLVEENLGLVYKVAERYHNSDIDREDLIQEGNLGLIRAAELFEPNRGLKFSTYAVWWIRCYMTRAVNADRLVKIPEWVLTRRAFIWRAREVKRLLTGEWPDSEEMISELKSQYSNKTVRRIAALSLAEQSMDVDLNNDWGITLHDLMPDEGAGNPEVIAGARLQLVRIVEALAELPKCQGSILSDRWGLSDGSPKTLQVIGDSIGLSRERVRQIESAAKVNLRRIWAGKETFPMRKYRRRKRRVRQR